MQLLVFLASHIFVSNLMCEHTLKMGQLPSSTPTKQANTLQTNAYIVFYYTNTQLHMTNIGTIS